MMPRYHVGIELRTRGANSNRAPRSRPAARWSHDAHAHYVNGWCLTVQGQPPREDEMRGDPNLTGAAANELRAGRGDALAWMLSGRDPAALAPRAKRLRLAELDASSGDLILRFAERAPLVPRPPTQTRPAAR